MPDRTCAWCRGPILATVRRDAICCSKRCRQARHRFSSAVGVASPVVAGHPRRIAYADPPYPGLSKRYYGDHPDYAGEVDHAALVASLSADYDAWALSTSASALQGVLEVCPPGVRVAAWVRGPRPRRDSAMPLNAWEPVIYGGQIIRRATPASHLDPSTAGKHDASRAARARVEQDLHDASCPAARPVATGSATRADALIYRPGARTTDPGRVIGAKPAEFCRWIFDLLAAQPGDELVDVFPGSGGVARAWEVFTSAAAQHDASRPTSDATRA